MLKTIVRGHQKEITGDAGCGGAEGRARALCAAVRRVQEKPLTGERVVVGSGSLSFHPSCLKCHECRKPLQGAEPFVVTDNLRFHRSCFFCHEPSCHAPLADVGHFRHEGRNLCREHYENVALPRCIKCDEPLRGPYTTFAEKAELPGLSPRQKKMLRRGSPTARPDDGMCRKCFKCAECKAELLGRNFFEHEGKSAQEAPKPHNSKGNPPRSGAGCAPR